MTLQNVKKSPAIFALRDLVPESIVAVNRVDALTFSLSLSLSPSLALSIKGIVTYVIFL